MTEEIQEEDPETKKKEKIFDVCLETRNMEIDLFWKRSIFFWGFISVAFAGYAVLKRNANELSIYVACFGVFSSLAWVLVNRGSKWWQQNWEEKLWNAEADITGPLFTRPEVKRKEMILLGASRYSVTKVTTLLSYFSLVIWLLILGKESAICFKSISPMIIELDIVKALPLIVTAIFIIIALVFTRGKNGQPDS